MELPGREEKTFIFNGTIPPRRSVYARQGTQSGVGVAFARCLVIDCPYLRFFLKTSTRIAMTLSWPVDPMAFRAEVWLRRVFLAGQYDVYDLAAPMNQTGYLLIPYSVFSIQLSSWSLVPADVLFEAHCSSD